MHRRYSLVVLSLTNLVFVLLTASFSFSQSVRRQGQSQRLPSDVFAAGGSGNDCNWRTGACDLLHAYLSRGGSDPRCLGPLRLGVSLERQEQALEKGVRQSYELVKQLNDLQQQRDRVLAGVPRDCFASGNGIPNWPKEVKTPDDIPIGPIPLPKDLKPIKQLIERSIRAVIQQAPDALRFGPDWPAYEQLRVRYATDSVVQRGYESEKLIVQQMQSLIGNSQNAAVFTKQIANLNADISLNRADMNLVRQKAMQILQRAAVSNPGMAVSNGLQTLLDFDFPPVQ